VLTGHKQDALCHMSKPDTELSVVAPNKSNVLSEDQWTDYIDTLFYLYKETISNLENGNETLELDQVELIRNEMMVFLKTTEKGEVFEKDGFDTVAETTRMNGVLDCLRDRLLE
tara:strand:+ start:855 stop:1196 length:342 start_codon:yes stop_codon:yes gene_type:complete